MIKKFSTMTNGYDKKEVDCSIRDYCERISVLEGDIKYLKNENQKLKKDLSKFYSSSNAKKVLQDEAKDIAQNLINEVALETYECLCNDFQEE